jgi:hypothetical protein
MTLSDLPRLQTLSRPLLHAKVRINTPVLIMALAVAFYLLYFMFVPQTTSHTVPANTVNTQSLTLEQP